MNLSALCKCCTFASLMITVIGKDFVDVSLTNDADTVLSTGYVLDERLHAEIGGISPLFRNPGNNDDLLATVEQQIHSAPSRRQLSTCKLQTTCFNRNLKDCDFTGCQSETILSLHNKGLTGPLPTDLERLLPELSELCVPLLEPEIRLFDSKF